jgi:hypothetical protein
MGISKGHWVLNGYTYIYNLSKERKMKEIPYKEVKLKGIGSHGGHMVM